MTETDDTPDLHTALAAAQAEMPSAAFNRINPHFKSRYADLSAIHDAVTPALSKHGLSLNHELKLIDGHLMLIAVLAHGKSKQKVTSEWPITGTTPQTRGSDLTYGRRYTSSCLTGVVADEDDDAEVAEKETRPPTAYQVRKDRVAYAEITVEVNQLIREINESKTVDALKAWGTTSRTRVHKLPDSYQAHLREEYERRMAEIEEGVTEDGNELLEDTEFKKRLRESLDDEVPADGGGDEA